MSRAESISQANGNAFDINVAMQTAGGDQQVVGELMRSMLEETPKLMDRISGAVDARDRDALRVETHTLKGSVSMLGAAEVSYAAAKLELADTDDDEVVVGQWHAELKDRIDTLLDAIDSYVCD